MLFVRKSIPPDEAPPKKGKRGKDEMISGRRWYNRYVASVIVRFHSAPFQ